ncbi:OB-fold domain-containing protein [Cytobacillus kochii]|uniref:Zn-ribbon domain-containing OB-fold protein n=1 Tax=Cytobacillus kochii TaxID=859143 RepID=UPI001CD6442B|nr:OB-fold domain-containing protein [Cytobacillus kochii]MCA1025936.1 OB-fold domain-containing protein [Cytobacillus kochii]
MDKIMKPLPIIDNDSKFFWEGCEKEKLFIQQCQSCSLHIFYPRILCPHCGEENVTWVEASGEGTIYSYTIARRAGGPAFKEDLPYCVALIDLKEGVRMMTNIIDTDMEAIHCNQQVKVVFQKVGEMTLPMFTPV